jgi:hypothetical protein
MKRYAWIFLMVVFLFPTLACTQSPFYQTPTPTITPTSTSTPTPTKTLTPTRTATPTGIPGITMPVKVTGVSLQFTSVKQASHWLVGSSNYTPTSSQNTFLVVKADILSPSTAHATIASWTVTLNDETKWTFLQSHGNSSAIDSVEWVFVVSKSLSAFTINLPGGVDVALDSLY